jgi:protein-tyrosine phosphatase
MDCTRILDNLHIGSCPRTSEEVDALQHAGITAVLNLQTQQDEAYLNIDWPCLQACYQQYGIEVRRIPVRDFDPKNLEENLPQCIRMLAELVHAGHTVYMHCTAGTGRSPTVAIAYLHMHSGMSLGDAYKHVRSRRFCSPTIAPSALPRVMSAARFLGSRKEGVNE